MYYGEGGVKEKGGDNILGKIRGVLVRAGFADGTGDRFIEFSHAAIKFLK